MSYTSPLLHGVYTVKTCGIVMLLIVTKFIGRVLKGQKKGSNAYRQTKNVNAGNDEVFLYSPKRQNDAFLNHREILRELPATKLVINLNYISIQSKTNPSEKLNLTGNHFYYTLLGELYTGLDHSKAIHHFEMALSLAGTEADKQTIQTKIDTLRNRFTTQNRNTIKKRDRPKF